MRSFVNSLVPGLIGYIILITSDNPALSYFATYLAAAYASFNHLVELCITDGDTERSILVYVSAYFLHDASS